MTVYVGQVEGEDISPRPLPEVFVSARSAARWWAKEAHKPQFFLDDYEERLRRDHVLSFASATTLVTVHRRTARS